MIEEGLRHLRGRNYEAALEQFKQAYDILPSPAVEARIALAEHGLERWIDAELHLKNALLVRSDQWVKQNQAILERTLKDLQSKLGWLLVQGSPDGAAVKIDGITRGFLPKAGPIRVEAKEATIEVAKEGYASQWKYRQVDAGKTAEASVNLLPNATTRAAAAAPQSERVAASVLPEPIALKPGAKPSRLGQKLGYTLALVGASATAGAILVHSRMDEPRDPASGQKRLPFIIAVAGAATTLIGLEFLFIDYVLNHEPGSQGALTLGVRSQF